MDIVQVFYDLPERQGNFASVALHGDHRDTHRQAGTAVPPHSLPIAHCQVDLPGDAIRLSCYQNQHKIACCGHGLYASAYTLFRQQNAQTLDFGGGVSAQLQEKDAGEHEIWLRLPALDTVRLQTPGWTKALCTRTGGDAILPLDSRCTVDEAGYLLLELSPHTPLAAVNVDLDLIKASTKRAVILWQRDQKQNDLVYMRYFAPQYGNDEDAATGSALRVLAPVVDRPEFTVIQCSSQGGRMSVRCNSEGVGISGKARFMAIEDVPRQWQN